MNHIDNIFSAFAKKLQGMNVDLKKSQISIVRKLSSTGLASAKRNTPTGKYSKKVDFTTADGEHVKFSVNTKKQGGNLKRSWYLEQLEVSGGRVKRKLVTSEEAPYAIYVNNGHRLVRNGVTIKYIPGQFFLEAALKETEKSAILIFQDELRKVKTKNGL